MRTVRIIETNKHAYLPLLLEADPDEAMIARYLDQGVMYLLEDDGIPAAVAVTVRLEGGICELKNIATDPNLQRRGYGSELLRHVFAASKRDCTQMLVGTTAPMLPFYHKLGFTDSHVLKNFFLDNYPEPIFENGVQCVDMLYLRRPL